MLESAGEGRPRAGAPAAGSALSRQEKGIAPGMHNITLATT
jgi:hypothetical protein